MIESHMARDAFRGSEINKADNFIHHPTIISRGRRGVVPSFRSHSESIRQLEGGVHTARSDMICGPGCPKRLPHTGTMGFAHATRLTACLGGTPCHAGSFGGLAPVCGPGTANDRPCSRAFGLLSALPRWRWNILAAALYWGGERKAMA